jgi:CBS domain containing-hemolysin-like protein
MFVGFNILTAVFFLILAGFFSGMETGIYVLDPLRYHVRLKQGDKEARLIERLLRKKSQLVTGLLVGTNLSTFLATIYATKMTELLYPGASLAATALVTTGFTTAAVLIFGEMLPKNLYRKKANTLVYSSARAFYIFNCLFLPFVKALSLLTGGVNFVFGRHGTLENEFLTRKAVEHHLTGEPGRAALTQRQMVMVRNVMQLPVKDILTAMIPLKDTIMVSESAKREDVLGLVRKKRFSRMPVYRGNRSDIISVLNIFDLFYESARNGAAGEQGESQTIAGFVRPIPSMLRSTRIDEALAILREARQPMGLVVGPKKNALGIVTVKDLLEEITGEIGAW